MYGSEGRDLLVKYYDDAFGISGEAELAWYLSRVRTYGGPVLDLACGTGRLALLCAREGYEVTGVDQSKGMLNLFERKLNREPPEVREKVEIRNQKMTDFNLNKKFRTVICCDAFFHNLTVEDQISCLKGVAQHLTSQGRFLFNLPNPTCEFILKCASSQGREFTERGHYTLRDGSLLVEQVEHVDMLNQIITTTLRFTRYDKEGDVVDKGVSTWKTRYLFRYEAVHLLCRCGFKIDALVGDYEGGPVTEDGQLIFDVKLS